MEMPGLTRLADAVADAVADAGADALLAQKIAPLHGLWDRSYKSYRSNRSYGKVRRIGMPRGGIINRIGGVKIVAKGEVGRAAATLGVHAPPTPQSRIAAK
jgi:hypothetical protein